MTLATARDRDEVVQVFEGLSQRLRETTEGTAALRRPLFKSYMLETVPPPGRNHLLLDCCVNTLNM